MTTNGEQNAGAPRRRRRRGGSNRQATQANRRPAVEATAETRESVALRQIIDEFVLCGRCSFFLSGCRVAYGLDALETAAQAAVGASLSLPWGMSARRLLHESYGFDIDSTLLWFEGSCRECGRRFVFGDPDREEGTERLYIQLVSS